MSDLRARGSPKYTAGSHRAECPRTMGASARYHMRGLQPVAMSILYHCTVCFRSGLVSSFGVCDTPSSTLPGHCSLPGSSSYLPRYQGCTSARYIRRTLPATRTPHLTTTPSRRSLSRTKVGAPASVHSAPLTSSLRSPLSQLSEPQLRYSSTGKRISRLASLSHHPHKFAFRSRTALRVSIQRIR